MSIMKIAIMMLLFSTPVFAADKPVWTIDAAKLNLPQYEDYRKLTHPPDYDPEFKIQFSSKDEIMLSFFQRGKQPVLTIKDSPEISGLSLITLFLSKEIGKLINKAMWPAEGELDWWERAQYGSRIYPLPDNGYVGMVNKRLQVLNSSLNVIHDRLLERLPKERYVYEIYAPLHGTFFTLTHGSKRFSEENDIIDYKTFNTVDRVSDRIVDIWEDKLLLVGFWGDRIKYLFEKRIGSSLEDFNVKIDNFTDAKFTHNGAVIVLEYKGNIPPPYAQHYWFTIENGKTGNPVFVEGGFATSLVVARKAPVVAVSVAKLRSFDRSSVRINVYDINTQQKLLQTKNYNEIIDCALSSDGRSLVVLTEKRKIELYKVPASSGAKEALNNSTISHLNPKICQFQKSG